MYRLIKILRTRNDKIRVVVVRRYRDRGMAEYAACIIASDPRNFDSVVGFQKI